MPEAQLPTNLIATKVNVIINAITTEYSSRALPELSRQTSENTSSALVTRSRAIHITNDAKNFGDPATLRESWDDRNAVRTKFPRRALCTERLRRFVTFEAQNGAKIPPPTTCGASFGVRDRTGSSHSLRHATCKRERWSVPRRLLASDFAGAASFCAQGRRCHPTPVISRCLNRLGPSGERPGVNNQGQPLCGHGKPWQGNLINRPPRVSRHRRTTKLTADGRTKPAQDARAMGESRSAPKSNFTRRVSVADACPEKFSSCSVVMSTSLRCNFFRFMTLLHHFAISGWARVPCKRALQNHRV